VSQQQYRWSGLAGIAGSALFIFVFIFVGAVVGADASIAAFPDVRVGRTVENTLYLGVMILWIAPILALGRVLREAGRAAAAAYGTVLAVIGLAILAAGALPHVASVPIADLYHAPGATPADTAALEAAWQGNQAILTMLLVTGLVVEPIGVLCLGAGMLRSPSFGRGLAWASLALGAIGVAVAGVLLVDPLSPIAAVGFFALIAFHLGVGWRLVAMSRVPVDGAAWSPAVTGRSAG
jgi:hypothetical protein